MQTRRRTPSASTRERSAYGLARVAYGGLLSGSLGRGKQSNLSRWRKTRTACPSCRDAHAAIADSGAAVARRRLERRVDERRSTLTVRSRRYGVALVPRIALRRYGEHKLVERRLKLR